MGLIKFLESSLPEAEFDYKPSHYCCALWQSSDYPEGRRFKSDVFSNRFAIDGSPRNSFFLGKRIKSCVFLVMTNLRLGIFLGLCVFASGQSVSVQKPVRGVIFDTQVRDEESFAPARFLAKEQGLELDYIGMDKILDWKMDRLADSAGQVAFFQMSSEFFRGWQRSVEPTCSKFLKLLKIVGQKPDTVVVLMLPSVGKNSDQRLALFSPLVRFAGIEDFESDLVQAQRLKSFLERPLEQRKPPFHTVLTPPAAQMEKDYQDKSLSGWAIPLQKPKMSVVMDFFYPLSLHLKQDKSSVLVSSSALLGMVGPTENFQLMPIASNLAGDMMAILSQFFVEIKNLAEGQAIEKPLKPEKIPSFKKVFEGCGLAGQNIQAQEKVSGKSFSKVSWMEIDDFCSQEAEKQKFARELVDRTLDAGLDWVWISLSPNTLLTDNAINKFKAEVVMSALEKFALKLSQEAEKRGQITPKFLLGFELGNNIVEKNAPKNFAHDIFGNPYPDIPEPLDFNFWKEELLKPLKMFLDRWNGGAASKHLPVEGVVLDIEFYNRIWTSMFLPTMGFGKKTRETFALHSGQKKLAKLDLDDFLKKMAENRGFSKYFGFVRSQTQQLAEKLKAQLEKLLPGKTVCLYLPNISLDSFHTPFMAGLSSKDSPIHIFSFNSRFDSLTALMEAKGIHASHGAAFMLSKVTPGEEFGPAKELYEHNTASSAPGQSGGIWLNRFSRIVHPFQPGQWFFLEQASANDFKKKKKFCNFLSGL